MNQTAVSSSDLSAAALSYMDVKLGKAGIHALNMLTPKYSSNIPQLGPDVITHGYRPVFITL